MPDLSVYTNPPPTIVDREGNTIATLYVIPTYPTDPPALLLALLERELERVRNNFGFQIETCDGDKRVKLEAANAIAVDSLQRAVAWVQLSAVVSGGEGE